MCGIAGLISKENREEDIKAIAEKMIDAVAWRGPDDKGAQTVRIKDNTIGLAHRRLSILDLSANGHQPMQYLDGRYTIVYNGEIYNYKEIRDGLLAKGHSFISDCDTEVVLHACIEYGVEKAVRLFNGMWSFAFLDREKGVVTLSRDRLGVKPLYYYKSPSEFGFASDMRSFFEIPGFRRNIDFESLHGFLWNMYVPAPRTILEGVNKLSPGCYLEYDIYSDETRIVRYWSPEGIIQNYSGSYDDYVDDIERTINDAVKLRLEADVAVGVFLSGGIDSSVITAMAQRESINKINTFSIGFAEKTNDDAKVAVEVSRILGTNHKELYCTQQDALDLIQLIPEAYGEPFADNSQIPTMLLSRMTKEHVTVALSGDGGDEIFLGYPSYINKDLLLQKRNRFNYSMRLFNVAAKMLPIYDHNRWKIEKFYNASSITNVINLEYITAKELINSLFDKAKRSDCRIQLFGGSAYEKAGLGLTKALDLQTIEYSLPDDMLTKVDRASMFYSLECRCPILDYRVVEASLSVPIDYNLHNGQLKAPLKDILYKYVPKSIVERPKSGFGIPINKWLHEDLNELVNDYLAPDLIMRQGLFLPSGIERFQKEFNNRNNPNIDRIAYTLLMFQMWWMRYCD